MRLLISLLAPSTFALLVAAPALAGDIEAASHIDAVTVFPDAAAVQRITDVNLPAGDTVLTFKNLPMSLDPASLRVEGEGSGAIVIGAVDTSVAPTDVKTPDSAIEAKLASLHAEREGWQSTIDALQAKRAMIQRYAQAGPEKLSPDAKPLDISQWSVAWDTVAVALAKLGDDLRPALAKARELDEQIKALEAERQRPAASHGPRRIATVALSSDQAILAKIKLTYRVAGASWAPIYDATLDTSATGKKIALSRRASLSQRTGEDWSDVTLTVSTARVAQATNAPDVTPWKIDFWQPLLEGAVPAGAPRATDMAAKSAAPLAQAVTTARPPVAAQESAAVAEGDAYSAEFKTAGRISLSSDGAQQSFLLSRLNAEPTLRIKTAPALDESAYLEAHFVDTEDAPLLAGAIALHRDGAYIGAGQMAFVAPGDSVDLGFGVDDKIKVQRVPVKRKENEPTWYNQTKIDQREFKTTVKNLHDFPVKVQVIDRLPFSENAAITVDLLPATTTPTEKQVGDKRGVMSWTLDLAPGEAKEVHLAYRLKWPADRDVNLDTQ
jgi:uncharacterized protein (TIGR02231 family)